MPYITVPQYKPTVRINNWFEDICLEQERIEYFRYARDNGDLLVEKTRNLFDNFHRVYTLSPPTDYVSFGSVMQLMPTDLNICRQMAKDTHPALAVIINENVVRHKQRINDDCELTVAPMMQPSVRNSFRVVSHNEVFRERLLDPELLKYGQLFRIECVQTEDDPILLYSAPKLCNLSHMIPTTFCSTNYGEVNIPLGLCYKREVGPGKDIPHAYTHWFCQHIRPDKRFETEGQILPSNSPLIITNAATRRNLAVENAVIQTLFGPELLVSVQTYKDKFNRETWKNRWMLSNGHQFKFHKA